MATGLLATMRLNLRRLAAADATRISLLAGDWQVSRMLAAVPHPYDETMAGNWIGHALKQFEAGAACHFAIERREDTLLIGGIGLEFSTPAEAELGYWLGHPYWGCGYGAEAAGRVIEFGFAERGLDLIIAAPLPANGASLRILEKLGFTFQGLEEQHFSAHGVKKEVANYALTRAEFSARNQG